VTRSKPSSNQTGFTLFELVLVAVVIGILMLAAVPRLAGTAQRLQIEQAAFELARLLRAAHEQAVFSGSEAVWTWNEDTHAARVELQGLPIEETDLPEEEEEKPDAEETEAPNPALQGAPLPEAVSVTVLRDDEEVACRCVRFYPSGTAEPTILQVRSDRHAYEVSVDAATGQTKVRQGLSTS